MRCQGNTLPRKRNTPLIYRPESPFSFGHGMVGSQAFQESQLLCMPDRSPSNSSGFSTNCRLRPSVTCQALSY